MADNDNKTLTHTAWAYRRISRKYGKLLECGKGRIDGHGVAHLHLDRTPLNGFTGYIQLVPAGAEPSLPVPKPQRPGEMRMATTKIKPFATRRGASKRPRRQTEQAFGVRDFQSRSSANRL